MYVCMVLLFYLNEMVIQNRIPVQSIELTYAVET